jgi:hypothetical protein
MTDELNKDRIIQRLMRWAEERESVRAMLLTSTRTSPRAHMDLFSDYDVVLAVTDIHPYFEDRAWLEDFGRVLVVYRDPIQLDYGIEMFAYITQYEDALKIDFMLWPVEMMAAKYNLDQAMKMNNLRLVLEWRMEIDRGWKFKPGAYGKGLKRYLPPETWRELESTYAGADEQGNWDALFKTIALFRRVAIEVGQHLGYDYPYELDRRVMAYLKKVQTLDRRATSFPR